MLGVSVTTPCLHLQEAQVVALRIKLTSHTYNEDPCSKLSPDSDLRP